MAATRLIALHINKGKTVAQCLRERTDYAQNPEKTAKGDLVTGYQCDPMTVDEEFLLSKRQYQHITGKHQKHEVIAYQIRQSFKPGEITPEEANQVGYELAERFTKGKHAFIVATHTDRAHMFMMSQAFPQAILLLAIYNMMNKAGLLGSYWALIISYVVFTLPVGTWTLKSYFDQLPDSLIESAKLDGAGHLRIMLQIVFPLVVPGMVSIAIYGFVWSWNDLLYSMTLVTDTARRTLASGLVMTFLGEASTNWGLMMAASIVSAIPVTIIFVFLQRYFIQGLTSGAVKG